MHGEAPKKSLVQQVRRRKPTTPLVSMSLSSAIQRAEEPVAEVEGSTPTHIHIMTEDGWKALEMSKNRISRS
jgi:hypothetical protein